MQAIDTFEFTAHGRGWVAYVYPDDDAGAPWENEDGHGEVMWISDREALPRGWTVIHDADRGRWIYNTGAAIVKARRENWGIDEKSRYFRVGMSRGARAYAAVKGNRDYLAGYLRDEWGYLGVSVQPAGTPDDFRAALWGVVSGDDGYLCHVASEMAHEWLATV